MHLLFQTCHLAEIVARRPARCLDRVRVQ
jgi:hypothetical protein